MVVVISREETKEKEKKEGKGLERDNMEHVMIWERKYHVGLSNSIGI